MAGKKAHIPAATAKAAPKVSFIATRVKKAATIVSTVNAHLPILPAPLKPRVPLIVTVETWSDGVVSAQLPIAALYGDAETDTEALDALGEAVLDFVKDVKALLKKGPIGGPLLKQWQAIQALVEIPNEVE